MSTVSLILIALLLLMGVAFTRLRSASTVSDVAPPRRPKTLAPRSSGQCAANGSRAPTRTATIECDHKPVAATAGASSPTAGSPTNESLRTRMRDRYIAARFPGLFRGAGDLVETDYVIKVARHFFEEGILDRANELFALAIPLSPDNLPLRLAQLEIAFLARDVSHFTSLALGLRASHPDIPEWEAILRLGRALAVDNELFAAQPHDDASRYGPWPDMPNWIQASWDLNYEVLAAEFHRAMSVPTAPSQLPALGRAA